jgi:CDGSH-type Zn-finger protein
MAKKIKISKDGPYLVTGECKLKREAIGCNKNGESVKWEPKGEVEIGEAYALCRCGQSKKKPFCDGSHMMVGFDGTETASREQYLKAAKRIEGPELDLLDVPELCAEARFCHPYGSVWNTVAKTDDPEVREVFAQQCADCPSGRYTAWDKEKGEPIEPELGQSISLTEDPEMGVAGPLWVKGRIPVESSDGTEYEVRNRVTLCRCGGSKNKPFCDGSHIGINFKEE